MVVNFNVGLLGHVDSGKTTLARALSAFSSTAAFDKNPQSQQRGITLDLGFSGLVLEMPEHLRQAMPLVDRIQFTFVDCPGHASLIRTIIGGAQIIDLMLLVVDAQKGMQTQTAECVIIGELLQRKLIVVINKIDALPAAEYEIKLGKLQNKLRKILASTTFGENVPIYKVSALNGTHIAELCVGLCEAYYTPPRLLDAPLVMYADHCFSIKGQGTVCTGTIVQGRVAVNDNVELPALGEQRKVKSIQMFKNSLKVATMGDRIGLCLTQFDAKLLERGIIAQPGFLKPIYAICVNLQPIRYYKDVIKSKGKMHISVGHDTVMAKLLIFRKLESDGSEFDWSKEYEYVEEVLPAAAPDGIFVLLQFEQPVFATLGTTLIASKLDMDVHCGSCRLAFWGHAIWLTENPNYENVVLSKCRIFKRKQKVSTIQRVVNAKELVVQNLFKKESNRDMYVGKRVELTTGEQGCIERTFGQSCKVCVTFQNDLAANTLEILKSERAKEVLAILKTKNYIFNKQAGLFQ